jgi:hypothetical protein
MKKKPHIMREPRTLGDVFAVEFAPHLWGYCRVIRSTAIEIPAVFTRAAGMPDIDWSSRYVEHWRVFFLTAGTDPGPPVMRVGNAPFGSEAEADMPPTYLEPSAIEPRYTIEERGVYRYTNDPADLKGIARQITLLPPSLGAFLREKYETGALQEFGVRSAAVASFSGEKGRVGQRRQSEVDPAEPGLAGQAMEQLRADAPPIVLAKIVQPIGPVERERIYEEPLAEFLAEHDLGEVTGGGTMQDRDGSVLFAGIDIEVTDVERAIPLIAKKLAELGAPDGSVLQYDVGGETVVYPIARSGVKRGSRGT